MQVRQKRHLIFPKIERLTLYTYDGLGNNALTQHFLRKIRIMGNMYVELFEITSEKEGILLHPA